MRTREEEYVKMLRALGYEPNLAGMDEEDFDYVPSWSSRSPGNEPPPELNRPFRPVDRDFAERIFKMFARPFDPNWRMPNLDGPEYSQLPKLVHVDPQVARQRPGGQVQNGGGFFGREQYDPDNELVARAPGYGQGGNATGAEVRPMSGSVGEGGKDGAGNLLVDPLAPFPIGGVQNESQDQQTSIAPPPPKQPQELWDEHVWKSPEVINAQTPKEKREAVNRILSERRGEFDAAYKATYGDKAAGQWENDRKFTLNSMGDYVTAGQLRAFGWQNVNDDMVKDLNDTLKKYDITTPVRIRHFLAQAAKESGKGQWTTENGGRNYFIGNYWDDEDNRKDLGNLSPEDAVNYRGGGYIQRTGRNNYQAFRDEVNDDEIMTRGADRISEKYPWMSSGSWWRANNMNKLVDSLEGVDHDADVDKVTDVVNRREKAERRQLRKQYYKELLGIIPD